MKFSFLLVSIAAALIAPTTGTFDWESAIEGEMVEITGTFHEIQIPNSNPVAHPIQAVEPADYGSLPRPKALADLTPEEMCADYGAPIPGTSLNSSTMTQGNFSGPLAEYCSTNPTSDPVVETDEDVAEVDPVVTAAALGHYVQQNAQVYINAGAISFQPNGEAYVNKDVYFDSSAGPYQDQLTVLGVVVELSFEPARFTWIPGDGSSFTTGSSGGPWPSGDVRQVYTEPGQYAPAVYVAWTVQIRIPGQTDWLAIPGYGQTLTVGTPLTVVESEAVLTTGRDD